MPGAPNPPEITDAALTRLPKDLGLLLVTAGAFGVVLPGPGAPALIAGSLILWPKTLGFLEVWFRRRFPAAHRNGRCYLERFLADLEQRYPGSTRPGPGALSRS